MSLILSMMETVPNVKYSQGNLHDFKVKMLANSRKVLRLAREILVEKMGNTEMNSSWVASSSLDFCSNSKQLLYNVGRV